MCREHIEQEQEVWTLDQVTLRFPRGIAIYHEHIPDEEPHRYTDFVGRTIVRV